MLTGDIDKDRAELQRLIAHEDKVIERENRKGYHSMAQVAISSRNRYVKLLAELEAGA